MTSLADLPSPAPGRWRPLRIGLIDLFYYDVEEFHFHGGSLLLRGNNGTGKSKVLALTMPFLLDGELAPHRVEPDGDRAKRMEWNLLLGGRYEHQERIGYTWMEFGRCDADGIEQFVTIGCGLKAAAGRGMVRHWYFVTNQRVGPELSLLTPARTALTRDRLKEAVGDRGMVYDRAVDYRRGVDEALFGLGSRYDTLVSLLIQLRQPQLSKRPDERLLSRALTDALPPLDENLIAQVAEAFRGLDDEREALDGLQDVRKAADQFLSTYRRYARIAAKRKAAGPRRTHSQYEQTHQELSAAVRDHVEATRELAETTVGLEKLGTQRAELDARDRALRDSPEARSQEELGRAKHTAGSLTDAEGRRRRAAEQLEADVAKRSRQIAECTTDLAAAVSAVADAQQSADDSAEAARVVDRHRADVIELIAAGPDSYHTARQAADATARWRQQTLGRMASLLDTVDAADRELALARAEEERCQGAAAESAERVAAAEAAVSAAAGALVAATHAYLSRLALVRIADPATVLSTLEDWAASPEGANPAARLVHDASDAVSRELVARQVTIEQERDAATSRGRQVDDELASLRAGGHLAPPSPHTRPPSGRRDRPGAPLWKVIDFAAGVPDAERAGIEAALETAGLLDAWVSPTGALIGPDDEDVFVQGRSPVRPSLAEALVPAVDTGDPMAATLSAELVSGIIAAIGYGPQSTAPTRVCADGTFRLGSLEGKWHKESAAYVGEGAREAARRTRIAELVEEQELLDLITADCASRLDEIAGQLETVAQERAALPSDADLRDAHTMARSERSALQRAEQAAREAAGVVAHRTEAVGASVRAAEEFGDDVGLAANRTDLAAVRSAVEQYRHTLAALWPALVARNRAEAALSVAKEEQHEAIERHDLAHEEYLDAAQEATSARERYATLLSTVGVAVQELQRRLDEVEQLLEEWDRTQRATRAAQTAAVSRQGKAEGRRDTLEATLRAAETDRLAAIDSLRTFAGTGLLALACPELEMLDTDTEWAATPAVALARAIDRTLTDVDDGDRRWELDQQAVNAGVKVLSDGLSRHGHRSTMTVRDDAMLVDVTFQGRTQHVAELAVSLEAEISERERVLSARHREILENQLVNEVAASLQELVSAAEVQVAAMNTELAARPTSTGMQLRLVWRAAANAPAGLAPLRDKLLRQSADVWTADDRRRLGDFLEEQIKGERLRDAAATWVEQLTNALDYRAWHEFAIQRRQDGQWRSATGPASGGERVLAASVPLFAAAASYYASSGNPKSPRLIALDEAFAGVDDDSRAKCLGLLATFDLDVMMTSEREWGCYPEVLGLAISQLARREGIDAVLVTPWRWDGRARTQVSRPVPYVPVPAATSPAAISPAATSSAVVDELDLFS